MDDFRFGTAIRLVRQRRGWRQRDLAARSGISQTVISRMERGHLGRQTVDCIRAVAAALDIRVDVVPRWRAGDLDRLLNGGHSALHESVARLFAAELPAWVLAPEVSFAIFGERGVIDILAWHPGRRALLVIELKTDLADMNEVVGTFDRKRRLARQIGLDRGWDPVAVSAWLIVVGSRTNRRRIAAHQAMLRGTLPDDGRAIRRWLRDPVGAVAGLSFWSESLGETGRPASRPIRRVRVASRATAERGSGLGRHVRHRVPDNESPAGCLAAAVAISCQIVRGRLVGRFRDRSGGPGRSRGRPLSVEPGPGRRHRGGIAADQSPAGYLARTAAGS